jgi:hypothetical protein
MESMLQYKQMGSELIVLLSFLIQTIICFDYKVKLGIIRTISLIIRELKTQVNKFVNCLF